MQITFNVKRIYPPHPILVGYSLGIIKAGLLAYAETFCSAFPCEQWLYAKNSHLQWRDRIGFEPISLLLLTCEIRTFTIHMKLISFIIAEKSIFVCRYD